MEGRQGIGDKFHIGKMWYGKHIYTCRADRALETSYTYGRCGMGNTFIHVGQTGHCRQVVFRGDRGLETSYT